MQPSQDPSPEESGSADPRSLEAHPGWESRASRERSRFCADEDRIRLESGLRQPREIELEIGSGKGLFLTREAEHNPSRYFIGLELATKYARQAQSKLERLPIDNACFVACDAVAVMEQDVPDASLRAVHVYFPDPWWKSKHKKRRVLSDATIQNIERTLRPDGELHFWTDVLDYYEEAIASISELTKLHGPFYVPEPPALHGMDYRTHFERRTRLNGLPVYRARFAKSASAAVHRTA